MKIDIPNTLNNNLRSSIEVKNNFNKIKVSYRTFLEELTKEDYLHLISHEFNADEAKIAYKLLNSPEDISPMMLVEFGMALDRYKNMR